MGLGHGDDPVAAVLQRIPDGRVFIFVCLQAQQAGDDLKVILHPMMDFPEQDFLFGQGFIDLCFGLFALRHINHHAFQEIQPSHRGEVRLPFLENPLDLAIGSPDAVFDIVGLFFLNRADDGFRDHRLIIGMNDRGK